MFQTILQNKQDVDIMTEEALMTQLDEELERELILFNDAVNSFEYVIRTLVMVSGLHLNKAFEVTHHAHHYGYATVKLGSFNDLKPERDAICRAGIWVEIL